MKLFLDTANLEEIKQACQWGVIEGVTTNPSLVSKEKEDFSFLLDKICRMVNGPVSAEVLSLDSDKMIEEARELSAISSHIVIKVPITLEGLKAAYALEKQGIRTNVTLIFTVNQAIMAARAGASFVSPFIGRLDDIGENGVGLIKELVDVFHLYDFNTEIIAASIRHPQHTTDVARLGAHIATIPFKVLQQMVVHPLTDSGIKRFLDDWKKYKDA